MDFNKNIPIYIQIEEQIKLDIITNKYKPGEKIKSVREFALELKINPNTINRALLELEEEGLIITQRTSGKYITENKKRQVCLFEETVFVFCCAHLYLFHFQCIC